MIKWEKALLDADFSFKLGQLTNMNVIPRLFTNQYKIPLKSWLGVASYKKRGTMENFIKEAKDGFGFDQMKSHDFLVNEARMMLSLLAYNLTNWLRTLSFPVAAKGIQIQTIRTRLIKVASKLVKSGRSLHFKLSSSFVYTRFFWDVLTRVQQLKLN